MSRIALSVDVTCSALHRQIGIRYYRHAKERHTQRSDSIHTHLFRDLLAFVCVNMLPMVAQSTNSKRFYELLIRFLCANTTTLRFYDIIDFARTAILGALNHEI
jgi:hypothetical protein